MAHLIRALSTDGEIVAPSSDWARALGISDRAGTRAAISRSWAWLEQERFVLTHRVGRQLSVKLLREDGSGLPWIHPYESREPYFRMPKLLWTSGLWASLKLPAKAMLLAAYALQTPDKEFFDFPIDRSSTWYGLGDRTARAGLQQLGKAGVLRHWSEKRDAPSPVGYRYDRHYALNTLKISHWEPGQKSPDDL